MIREALDLVIEQVNTYRMYDGFELGNDYFGVLSYSLMVFGAIVLLLAILMGVFLYLTRQTIIVMSRLIEYDLREVIYDHYQVLSLDFYKRNNTGDLMNRITEDVNKVRMYIGPAVMYLANLISTILLVVFSMIAVSPTLTMYTLASTILTVYVGGLQVVDGTISAGNIAEFVIYVNMLTWPVTAIGWIASIVQQAAASQKRINEFLETKTSITDPRPEDRHEIKGDITFENVSFVYPDTGIKAIDGVSFHLKAGEKLAIIGRTGSGKTTIADLLLRMYDVTEGRILVDGKDIREQGLANLRQKIGYVPQDIFLFSDNIHNNIAFGSNADPTK